MKDHINFNDRITKALGNADAGAILEQEAVDRIIGQIVDYENPFRQNLPRRPGSGQAAIVNRRAPGTTVAQFVADTAESFNQSDATYTQASFPFKTILARGQVSRRLIAQGQSYIDVKTAEIEARANDYRDFEDNAILTSAVSATAFDGIQVLVTNIVTTTTAAGGDPLTLPKLDEAVDAANGPINMMIMSRRTRRELFALLLGQIETREVLGGFRLPAYAGIPIFTSTNVPDTQTFNGTIVTSNTGSNTSEIILINATHLWISELTRLTIRDVPTTTSNIETFEIFSDEAVVLRDTLSCVRLIGIAPA